MPQTAYLDPMDSTEHAEMSVVSTQEVSLMVSKGPVFALRVQAFSCGPFPAEVQATTEGWGITTTSFSTRSWFGCPSDAPPLAGRWTRSTGQDGG